MSHKFSPEDQEFIRQALADAVKDHENQMQDNAPKRAVLQLDSAFKLCPALCVDLDDTVRYSATGEFINSPEDVRVFPEAESVLWNYRDKGFLIFGISNQGGVSFGIKSAQMIDAEVDEMIRLFNRNPFHIIKCCLHHPKGSVTPYNHRSLLRKPDIGMLALCEVEAFVAGYVVDWDNSLMVGDRPEDEEMAKKANISFQWADPFFGRPTK